MPEIFDTPKAAAVAEIAERGWAVATRIVPEPVVKSLACEAKALWADGVFRQAGVGRRAEFMVRQDIRGDYIYWLDENNPTLAQSAFWAEIEKLRCELNRELFTSLVSFEAHYAIYPPGAFYKKHVDRFGSSDERIISCTIYLNEDWNPSDGGELRIYSGTIDDESYTDVYPEAGTVVLMKSDTAHHEVRPATKQRLSVTGWYRRRSSDSIEP